jgi:cobalt/nickel transport system permease protein
VAALSAAIMFGIQPMLERDAAGHALYAPYPLAVAVPAMALEHLLVFGVVEAVVTGLVAIYLQRADVSLFYGVAAPTLDGGKAK